MLEVFSGVAATVTSCCVVSCLLFSNSVRF